MKAFIYIIPLILLFIHCNNPTKSKDSKTITNTIEFINKTDKNITISDNSGLNFFNDFIVFAYSEKTFTYECDVTTCDLDWYYTYPAINIFYDGVCVCEEAYKNNELYTFGYCENVNAPSEESCESCRNQVACE